MDGYHGHGSSSAFNAGGSGNPEGYDFVNLSDNDDGRRTRNLFSLALPASDAGAYAPYTSGPPASGSRGHAAYAASPPVFGSGAYPPYSVPHPNSSATPTHLGFSGLNLNASSGYPHIDEYDDMLRSGQPQGGIGSSRAAPHDVEPAGSGGVDAPPGRGQRRRVSRGRGGRRSGVNNNPSVPKQTDRANWTKEDNKLFCEFYCLQLDVGTCRNGVMSKFGWKDIQDRFYEATGKLHDSEQFGYRFRELKKLWVFIDYLRHVATGVGSREDGSVVASDKWWDDKLGSNKNKQEWQDLKFGWPEYIDAMDRMFSGVAVTGETAYVPGVTRHINFDTSGDEDEALPAFGTPDTDGTPTSFGTPQYFQTPGSSTPCSSGSKRSASSTRSTAKSPGKKPRNTAARMKDATMSNWNSSYQTRTKMIQNLMMEKKSSEEQALRLKQQQMELQKHQLAAKEHQQELITKSAEELGLADMEGDLWKGVLNICKDEDARTVYLNAGPSGRLQLIKIYANDIHPPPQSEEGAQVEAEVESEEEDNWWELLWNLVVEDEAEVEEHVWNYGMFDYVQHVEKYCSRRPYRTPPLSGEEWVQNKLADEEACYDMFRMSPRMFISLHELLTRDYGLKSSKKSTSMEALGIFLWVCGPPQSVRQARDRFERSLATVHNLFYKVLECMVGLADDIITPRDPMFSTVHPRLQQNRFSPEFSGCIGAIDGTHIPVVVPQDKLKQYMCRKNKTTQNVMAACDFDMFFTFVLAGWPGSAHDMRVLDDAIARFSNKFKQAPRGKFYLVDSGYANRRGFLAPYRQTRYHLQDFQNAPEPQNIKETFNHAHSSLRNVIERAFGVLKMKWHILLDIPSYSAETQSQIICACMALHNFIRLNGEYDRDFGFVDNNINYVPVEASLDQPETVDCPQGFDMPSMNAVRDQMAEQLYIRYHS